ncbi:uncharacterized protein LOC122278621 [Carya illinoinensis]|uniref:uncharacterized protein LOC122278621 n=1 Tax=Carya illinoinensis TaxID=32201 RepID=UPI001C71C00F|nr:uncharacterized protein LOC122278621 [Carya illinoinensis]
MAPAVENRPLLLVFSDALYVHKLAAAYECQIVEGILNHQLKQFVVDREPLGVWSDASKVYEIPLGATIIEQSLEIGGYGPSYLNGFFDQAWREGMARKLFDETPDGTLAIYLSK